VVADTAADGNIVEENQGEQRPPKKAIITLDRLREYVLAALVQFQISIRPFTRWYFDLLKYALVIAAVAYFAEKTGSKTLRFIAGFSSTVFSLYCWSYLAAWEPWLLNRAKPPWRALLILLLVPVMAGVLYLVFSHTIHLVMKALLRAQH
jgi:hypothetical protein